MKPTLLILYLLFSFTTAQAQFNPKELDDLGAKVEEALNKKDGSLDLYFDNASFMRRIIMPNPKREEIKKLNRDLKKSFRRFSISNTLTKTPFDYTYKYIGAKKDSSFVIRVWDSKGDGGFNYLFLKLDLINETWKIIDVYVLMNAQYMSESLKSSVYMPAVIRLLDDTQGRMQLSNFSIYMEASSLLKRGEYQLAYNKISNIPLEERLRIHQIVKINLASLVDNDEIYLKSINEYKELFPNDASIHLILVDRYIIEEQYPEVHKALDAIKSHVLEDNFINYHKGAIYMIEGDYEKAKKEIKIAIRTEKEEEYYWMLLQVEEVLGNYKACIHLLKEMGKLFDLTQQTINERVALEYTQLALSEAYQGWKGIRTKSK